MPFGWPLLLAAASLLTLLVVTGNTVGRWWLERLTRVDLAAADAAGVGFDPEALDGLARHMMGERRSQSFVVARNGEIVLERYHAEPFSLVPNWAHRRSIASTSKAVVGGYILAIGICEGWLDPDASASRHLPSWRTDERRRAVTLRDLARHTSGLAGAPAGRAPTDQGPDWADGAWADNAKRGEVALRAAPILAARGVEVRYSNPGYSAYSVALARAAEAAGYGPDIGDLLRDRILRPLEIPTWGVVLSYERSFEAEGTRYREVGSGARATSRAMVRLGELVAGRGAWRGRRILEERCLDEVLRPDLAARPVAGEPKADHPAPAPAAGWWSNANGAWPELPADLVVAAGAEHRVVVVVPSLGLVAVRLGPRFGEDPFGGDFWRRLRDELLNPLLDSVRPPGGPALIAGPT